VQLIKSITSGFERMTSCVTSYKCDQFGFLY